MPNEEFISNDTVREKLLIAGITELEKHGISDFSLRRVASATNVSCAAPYKHFKNKEEFVGAIVDYIHSQWLMLSNQIMTIFENDKKKQLVELCVAYTRFCMGNSHFRSIINMNTDDVADNIPASKLHITHCITNLIEDYCKHMEMDDHKKERMIFRINALVHSTALVPNCDMNMTNDTSIALMRDCIEEELEQ